MLGQLSQQKQSLSGVADMELSLCVCLSTGTHKLYHLFSAVNIILVLPTKVRSREIQYTLLCQLFLLFLNEAISHFIWVHSHVLIGVVWLKFDLFRKYKK